MTNPYEVDKEAKRILNSSTKLNQHHIWLFRQCLRIIDEDYSSADQDVIDEIQFLITAMTPPKK